MTISHRGRGLQVRPTKEDLNAAWARLRSAANSGDLQATALLVALSENKPLLPALEASR